VTLGHLLLAGKPCQLRCRGGVRCGIGGVCGNRGRDEIFGVERCLTFHFDWPILTVRKIGGTELGGGCK